MAIKTITEKQLVLNVSAETAAKLQQLAKDKKQKFDDCVTTILDEAVKGVVVTQKKRAAAKKTEA